MNFFRRVFEYFKDPSERSHDEIQIVDGKIISASPLVPEEEILLSSPTTKKKTSPDQILTLNALLHHNDLKKGYIPIGLSKKTGELMQSTWKKMTTGIICGRRNFGKSSILKALALIALHAKKRGEHYQLYLFDPHHNLPDATGTFFKPILHYFDDCFLGMESLEQGKHLALFRDLKAQVQDFQEEGFDERTPWRFIFIDEADLLFKAKKHGKENYYYVEHLINLRKGRIFFLLSFADTTKAGSGDIGTSLVAAGTTVFCVNYDIIRARVVLQGPNEAQKAVNLPVGYAAIKIPDSKVQVCRMPYITEADLAPFLPAPQELVIQDGEIKAEEPSSRLTPRLVFEQNGIKIYSPTVTQEDDDETPILERLSEEAIRIEIEKLAQMTDEDGETGEVTVLPQKENVLIDLTEAATAPTTPPPESAAEMQSPQPAQPSMLSSYLTHDTPEDFDTFLTYLETSKKSQRTVAEYGRELKTWKRILAGAITTDTIIAHLKACSYHKAVRARAVLSAYAEYRHSIGDQELKVLLVLNPFTIEKPQADESTNGMSEKEVQMYWTTARTLCKEQNREGVWIGLSLLDVRPSEIKGLQIVNNQTIRVTRRKKSVTVKCPLWLIDALRNTKNWRQGRKTIHAGVSTYETTPSALNTAARFERKLDQFQNVSGESHAVAIP